MPAPSASSPWMPLLRLLLGVAAWTTLLVFWNSNHMALGAAESSSSSDDLPDFARFKVKELRAILAERNVKCIGCSEKQDLVDRVKETYHLPVVPKAEDPRIMDPTKDMKRDDADPNVKKTIDDLMAQFGANDNAPQDPAKEKILKRLRKKGLHFGGGGSMSIDELRNLENVMNTNIPGDTKMSKEEEEQFAARETEEL
ncbi:ARMET_C domain-containing protein [Pycnococcus provasolii]